MSNPRETGAPPRSSESRAREVSGPLGLHSPPGRERRRDLTAESARVAPGSCALPQPLAAFQEETVTSL
jgi:hypothetical protein